MSRLVMDDHQSGAREARKILHGGGLCAAGQAGCGQARRERGV
jgi:hypothetical protein